MQVSRASSGEQKHEKLSYTLLTAYFRLDTSGDLELQVYSEKKGSDASKTNRALRGIAKDGSPYTYINNRVLENVAAILIQSITGEKEVTPSTVVNDIKYGVDLIGKFDGKFYAIDITRNQAFVPEKLDKMRRDGRVELLNVREESTFLPFIVMYISGELLAQIAGTLEKYLKNTNNPKDASSLSQIVEISFLAFIRRKRDRISPRQIIYPYMLEGVKSVRIQQIFSQAIAEKMNPIIQ